MRVMYGPGGEGHCSVFNCLNAAVVTEAYDIFGGQPERKVQYMWCDEHIKNSPSLYPYTYPQFLLESKVYL